MSRIRESAEAKGFTEFFVKVWAIDEDDEETEFMDATVSLDELEGMFPDE